MTRPASRLGSLGGSALAALAALCLIAPVAGAATGHPVIAESFGSDGTPASQIGGLGKLSFNQASHRLYAFGTEPKRIYGFQVSGTAGHSPLGGAFPATPSGPENSIEIAADDLEGNVYYSERYPGSLDAFDSNGAPLGQNFPYTVLSGVGDVAVDSSGHPWVIESERKRAATGFNWAGFPLGREINLAAVPSPSLFEFDRGTDDLYVSAGYGGGVYRYTAASGYLEHQQIDPRPASALAFDKSTGTLYVAHEEVVQAFDREGRLVDEFGRDGEYHRYVGVAVNEETGVVYLADASQGRIVVAPKGAIPTVVTGEPTGDRTVSGSVDPAGAGAVTGCEVQYGPTVEYGETAPCTPIPPYTSPTKISATLPETKDERTYHYRVVATANNVKGYGADEILTPHFVDALRTQPASGVTKVCATLNASYLGNGEDTHFHFDYGATAAYGTSTPSVDDGSFKSERKPAYKVCELEPGTTYHFRVVAENNQGVSNAQDRVFATLTTIDELTTNAPTNVAATGATLNGSFKGNGEDVHYFFEWGPTTAYGRFTAASPGIDLGPVSGPTAVDSDLARLLPDTIYHYRVVASDGLGTSRGRDVSFRTPKSTPLERPFASEIHSDEATLGAEISAGGLATTYHFEYGTSACVPGPCARIPAADSRAGSAGAFEPASFVVRGLAPATTYFVRVVATNALGTTARESSFVTIEPPSRLDAGCPNPLARQQTGAALLLDCRAYELVSAADQGGYDVESDLVPGGTPYGGYPAASGGSGVAVSRVLYGVHFGGIPGTANPTGFGVDPYVATRGSSGWTTAYVGVPANDPYAAGPFSSEPTGVSATLDSFAFGGPGGCSPCFSGGSAGIPVRLSDGELVQGMVPSPAVPAPSPSTVPDGYVADDLSADGSHLVFASTARFASGGNDGTGDVSIYDRNLRTGETHTISFTPAGSPIPCLQGAGTCHAPGDADGIAELAISTDGSRILLGQKVGVDPDGNRLWHLYLNVGDATSTIDLTPGASSGVLFGGMTADGSRIVFSTVDSLTVGDTDASADIYADQIVGTSASIARISSGAAGDSDSCTPVGNSGDPYWNTAYDRADCSAVAVAGGSGLATGSGSIYFLSPERLQAGLGVQDEPNLYLATPGAAPRFVATLDADDPVVVDSVSAAESPATADFETTADGSFAAFISARALTGDGTVGLAGAYRYDAATAALACASCAPTGSHQTGAARLATKGSSLTEAGQVFFDSTDAILLRDTDRREDVYEFEPAGTGTCGAADPSFAPQVGACLALVSRGASSFDSSLLGVSADGTDAFIFTRDTLSSQDGNGPVVKLYDARVGGGFFEVPAPPPCAASDECHGPSSVPAGPPDIGTVTGQPGNVGKRHHRKKHRRRHHKKHRAHRHGKRIGKTGTSGKRS